MDIALRNLKTGYTLVVCEKPDAARRVSEAISESEVGMLDVRGVRAYRCKNENQEYIVCAATGHVYTVSDPFLNRGIYPVFDIEWFPHNQVAKDAEHAGRRIEVIRELSRGATKFVNACDYDVEGETIGFNILRYACGDKESYRVRFSTLTRRELRDAFKGATLASRNSLAIAGRTRHAIDFMWGINLTRALSESVLRINNRYKTISVGRVQGPTLSYVVNREVEIRSFVPIPFWTVKGIFAKGKNQFVATYVKREVDRLEDAQRVKQDCQVRDALVSQVTTRIYRDPQPTPFNTGDLQKEAYRLFGYSPSKTLLLAERLYLDALISYPRTNSQKLPQSINYRRILEQFRTGHYSNEANELLVGPLKPRQGAESDSAHPAVYPTGEAPRRVLQGLESKLLDLIIRRFFSAFAPEAVRQKVDFTIRIGEHAFVLIGNKFVEKGWLRYYGKYARTEESNLPPIQKGDVLEVISVDYEEKFERCPSRYDQGSLLEKMEKDSLGTKATRGETISTLIKRGYVTGKNLTATDLGFSVVETLMERSPRIISTMLTREVENGIREIENGEKDEVELLARTVEILSEDLERIKGSEVSIGKRVNQSILATTLEQNAVGACPICKTGTLIIVRSRSTHKRFVGCTNYKNGCRASAPLPQRGSIRTANKACDKCGWPILYVRLRRLPWNLCINVDCPTKTARKYEVSFLRKRS